MQKFNLWRSKLGAERSLSTGSRGSQETRCLLLANLHHRSKALHTASLGETGPAPRRLCSGPGPWITSAGRWSPRRCRARPRSSASGFGTRGVVRTAVAGFVGEENQGWDKNRYGDPMLGIRGVGNEEVQECAREGNSEAKCGRRVDGH